MYIYIHIQIYITFIQRAAKLRPRHRAQTKSNKAAILSICLSACSVYLSIASFQKSIQKSIQNPSKSSPKWSKIEVWREPGAALRRLFAPKRLWVASWAALGQLLSGSWRILGASSGVPGLSWAPGWGVQGRLEGSLEGILGEISSENGAKLALN